MTSTPPPPGTKPREPGRALQVPTPPNLGVLSSIISLILINQALGNFKMHFSGSRLTEFPFVPPPQTVLKMGFFTSLGLVGHFRYPTPLIWGC